jgi:hypothetical protein
MAKKRKQVKKRKNPSFGLSLLLVVFAIAGVWFMSSALIVVIGLMPMFVAFFVDRSKKKTKAVTVGAMNMAGITPFLLELWVSENSMEKALSIILDPMAIIVIYSAAGIGYIIDWAVTLAVANFMYQRGIARKKAIEERQVELIERWGEEVSGKVQLDHEGFPMDNKPAEAEA